VDRLIVCAALRIEAMALRRGLSTTPVIHVGYRARRAGRVPDCAALAVVGFGGALTTDLRPGDVLVATEIRGDGRTFSCHGVSALVTELRQDGLPAVAGPLLTTDHIVRTAEFAGLAATGAKAVDMESAPIAATAGDRPIAAVRVVVDTPDHPLVRPGTLRHGAAAFRTLRCLGPALERWAAAPPP
jgi:uridine phosphorylase